MNHQEIEENEIIERYVLHQLTADERRAFQEHYFSCDGCFEKAQMKARFIAGVRQSSVNGTLANNFVETKTATPSLFWVNWLKPAFGVAAVAALLLAVILGWLALQQIARLRQEVEREKQAQQQIEREKQEMEREQQQSLSRAQDELAKERQHLEQEKSERAKLQRQLAELARNQSPKRAIDQLEANAPIVILEALRDSQLSNQLTLPEQASNATLWVEVESGNRFASYRLQLVAADGRVVKTIAGAKRNRYGAVAVNLSARLLQTGKYVVRLYGLQNGQPELVGEYNLLIRKS
jgi:hypothetical protein